MKRTLPLCFLFLFYCSLKLQSFATHQPKDKTPTKYILTGGPGCGKTSTLIALELLHKEIIIPEAANDAILLKTAQGKENPWTAPETNNDILKLQIQRESNIQPNPKNRVFLDRSALDILAYEDRPSLKLQKEIKRIQNDPSYSKTVFLLKHLNTITNNNIRQENFNEALQLEAAQKINYEQHGFTIILIPNAPVEDRAQMILDVIES